MNEQLDESAQKELEAVAEKAKPGYDRFKRRTLRTVFFVVPVVLIAILTGVHSRTDDWGSPLIFAATAIGVFGSGIGLVGAFATDVKMHMMSMSFWGGNPELLEGLLKARFAAIVGLSLIMFGFLLFCAGQGFLA